MNNNDRRVRLEIGGEALFTQRGRDKDWGFVRVDGQTITGYRMGSGFYADIFGRNASVVTPSYLLPEPR